MIVEAGIVPRCVVQDLSRVARSSNFAMSLVDLEESYDLGVSAHMRSAKPEFTAGGGHPPRPGRRRRLQHRVLRLPRLRPGQLRAPLPQRMDPAELSRRLREALDYFRPLIQGEPKLICENGIPVTMRPFNRR